MESQRRGDDGRGERDGEEKMKAVLIDPPTPPAPARRCPRCSSEDTKFCYYNNYSQSQPRHFCKTCRRYWTEGGALRNIPVGGTARRYKRPRYDAALQFPATVPHQLIVPSAALLSRSASAPYLYPAQQINPGCGTGFFSSLVKLQSLNVDPFESVWGTYSGNYLHGVNYGTGFKLPKINLAAEQDDDRWSTFAAAGVRLPEVAAVRDDDESEDVKPDLRGGGDVDVDGAGASGSHGN